MTHASLFSGIGGFDLAAEWTGWTNVFNCEIDDFCRKILKYHFPNAQQYKDVTTTDFSVWRGRVDVLTGGFPCQPFSVAGKRKGTADDRYLWPAMLRAIREICPRWIVGENVYGIVNWSDGMVFEQVCADLENTGYEVQAYVIPACAVDAPHRRDRTWFVAHRADTGHEAMQERQNGIYVDRSIADTDDHRFRIGTNQPKFVAGSCKAADIGVGGKKISSANTYSKRFDQRIFTEMPRETEIRNCQGNIKRTIPDWQRFPTESPVCRGDDGFPARLDGITFSRWCRASIKAYGNAIVPQVAVQLFGVINQMEGGKPMK